MNIHNDFETFSEAILVGKKSVGGYRYASDPTTEILFMALGIEDEPPVLWSCVPELCVGDWQRAIKLCSHPDAVLYAHNAPFEIAIAKYLWEKTFHIPLPKLEQWRCTQAMCRRAAIPPSLEDAGEFLGLTHQKDKAGKALIHKFSELQKSGPLKGKRIHPKDDLPAFKSFGEYCIQDVVVEKEIHKTLGAFELKGDTLASFQFDLRMNERGVPVNIDALEKAQTLVDELNIKLKQEFRDIVGLNPTQRDKVLTWMRERGYPGKNMQALTVEGVLAKRPEEMGMDPIAHKALYIKSMVGFAALKKIPTMLACACDDGRVRGALVWSGAQRTHRWAGRIIQPQNFKKPVIKNTQLLYDFIQNGATVEALEFLYPNPLLAIASVIRHFIHDTL